jgi:hypothetical protein
VEVTLLGLKECTDSRCDYSILSIRCSRSSQSVCSRLIRRKFTGNDESFPGLRNVVISVLLRAVSK